MSAYRTWAGIGLVALAFFGLAVMPLGQKLLPLLAGAVGWFLITLDERVQRFAAQFPRGLGVVLIVAGFTAIYAGPRVFGPGHYIEIMGTALSLLSLGYLFVRRGRR